MWIMGKSAKGLDRPMKRPTRMKDKGEEAVAGGSSVESPGAKQPIIITADYVHPSIYGLIRTAGEMGSRVPIKTENWNSPHERIYDYLISREI